MTPSTHEIRSDPMEGNNGSLLHGTYDEAAAAADFQAAVQQFRNGGQENHISSSAVDQENQISEADKLKEVTNLFRSFSNNCFLLVPDRGGHLSNRLRFCNRFTTDLQQIFILLQIQILL